MMPSDSIHIDWFIVQLSSEGLHPATDENNTDSLPNIRWSSGRRKSPIEKKLQKRGKRIVALRVVKGISQKPTNQ